MYVLDEPSIGLHQRDNDAAARNAEAPARPRQHRDRRRARPGGDRGRRLRRRHGAGRRRARRPHRRRGHAGGDPANPALADRPVPRRAPPDPDARSAATAPTRRASCVIDGASGNNLKERRRCELPVGLFICITGVSGLGQVDADQRHPLPRGRAAPLRQHRASPRRTTTIHGLEFFDKVISVDQSPIGRTPRSNPATYTGLFTPIRELFARSRRRASAATGRAASPSTSRAAAARPARATA